MRSRGGFGAGLGLGVGLRADLHAAHARMLGVSAQNNAGDGIKGFAGGASLQLAYQIPIPLDDPGLAFLDRLIGVEAEAGYALTGTSGTVTFSQYENTADGPAPVSTTYSYGGLLHQVPLSLGLRTRLPLFFSTALSGLFLDLSGGFASVVGISQSSATIEGASAPFTEGNTAVDMALGFYLEGGAAFRLGPGELMGAYRYSSAYLDFGHEAWNPTPGDLGGHHLLVGYRFVL